MLRTLAKAFTAEWIKTKPTVAFKIALIAPLILVVIYSTILLYYEESFVKKSVNIWDFFTTIIWNFWSSLAFLPLIGLQTALVNDIEHAHNGWRNIFSLAIPRWTVYWAKLLLSIVLLLISLIALSISIFIAGKILEVIKPSLGFQNYNVSNILYLKPFLVLGGSLAIIAIHNFISTCYKNMFISVGISFILTIMTLFIIQNDNINIFSPWCWPALSSMINLIDTQTVSIHLLEPLVFSVVGFIIFSTIGIAYNTRRKIIV